MKNQSPATDTDASGLVPPPLTIITNSWAEDLSLSQGLTPSEFDSLNTLPAFAWRYREGPAHLDVCPPLFTAVCDQHMRYDRYSIRRWICISSGARGR